MPVTRAVPWVRAPSPHLCALLDKVDRTTFEVKSAGPVGFSLRDPSSSAQFKVCFGERHTCTCPSTKDCCIHILYVFIRVLGLERDDPLCWQGSWIDSEIEDVVGAYHWRLRQEKENLRQAQKVASQGGTVRGSAMPIAEEVVEKAEPVRIGGYTMTGEGCDAIGNDTVKEEEEDDTTEPATTTEAIQGALDTEGGKGSTQAVPEEQVSPGEEGDTYPAADQDEHAASAGHDSKPRSIGQQTTSPSQEAKGMSPTLKKLALAKTRPVGFGRAVPDRAPAIKNMPSDWVEAPKVFQRLVARDAATPLLDQVDEGGADASNDIVAQVLLRAAALQSPIPASPRSRYMALQRRAKECARAADVEEMLHCHTKSLALLKLFEPRPSVRTAKQHLAVGRIYTARGAWNAAVEHLNEAVALGDQLVSTSAEAAFIKIDSLALLGACFVHSARPEDAQQITARLQCAVDVGTSDGDGQGESGMDGRRGETIKTLHACGVLCEQQGLLEDARTLLQRLVALLQQDTAMNTLDLAVALSSLARVAWRQRQLDEAYECSQQALALFSQLSRPHDWASIWCRFITGVVLEGRGLAEEVKPFVVDAATSCSLATLSLDLTTPELYVCLANLLRRMQLRNESLQVLRCGVAHERHLHGATASPDAAHLLDLIATALVEEPAPTEHATQALVEALHEHRSVFGPTHPATQNLTKKLEKLQLRHGTAQV